MKNKFLLCFFLFLPIFIYSLEPPENQKNVIKAKKLIEKIVELLKSIEDRFPPKAKRFIEVEL